MNTYRSVPDVLRQLVSRHTLPIMLFPSCSCMINLNKRTSLLSFEFVHSSLGFAVHAKDEMINSLNFIHYIIDIAGKEEDRRVLKSSQFEYSLTVKIFGYLVIC